MSTPVLEIDSLTAGYDSAAVIRDISLEVGPGEEIGRASCRERVL